MRYLSRITTSIIRVSLIFLLTIMWTNNIIKNSYVSITISASISIAAEIIISIILAKKNKSHKRTEKEQKQIEKTKTILLLTPKQYVVDKIYDIYKAENDCEKYNGYILITDTDTIIYPIFYKENVDTSDIANVYNTAKEHNIKNINILCIQSSQSAATLCQQISDKNITISDINSSYENIIKSNLEKFDFDIKLNEEKPHNLNFIKQAMFDKKLTKNYIFSGILLIFASFFTKYYVLYEIMGSVMILFSLVCLFGKKENTN